MMLNLNNRALNKTKARVRCSVEGVVEPCVSLGDGSSFIVLIHLRQRVSVFIQLTADLVPPNWEMFLHLF